MVIFHVLSSTFISDASYTLMLECAWEKGEEDFSKIAPPASVLKACGSTEDAVGAGKVASTLARLL